MTTISLQLITQRTHFEVAGGFGSLAYEDKPSQYGILFEIIPLGSQRDTWDCLFEAYTVDKFRWLPQQLQLTYSAGSNLHL
jgi:hypothetical protein